MTPAFESFVARLYTDAQARRRFLADAAEAAAASGLGPDEIAAVVRIDRVGLELAASIFDLKRRRPRRRGALEWVRRLIFGRCV